MGDTLGVATSRRGDGVLLRPAAFMKLMFCCHAATTEIGGFGISSAADPLIVEEFVLVRQKASSVTVTFHDEAVADHVDHYADQGVAPGRSARIWIHTHPGNSASPSDTDERTFANSFGGCDWSAMLIQSHGREQYCRLQFTAGPGGESLVPVEFDWAGLPAWLLNHADALPELVRTWKDELEALVTVEECFASWGADAFDANAGIDRGLHFRDFAPSSYDPRLDPRDVDEEAFLRELEHEYLGGGGYFDTEVNAAEVDDDHLR